MMMVNRILVKVRVRSGETISETLVALLISSLALVMLASMINSTVNLVSTSKKKMNEYYEACAELENFSAAQSPAGDDGDGADDGNIDSGLGAGDASGSGLTVYSGPTQIRISSPDGVSDGVTVNKSADYKMITAFGENVTTYNPSSSTP